MRMKLLSLKQVNQKPNLLELDFIECPDIAQTVVCSCVGLKMPFFLKDFKH